MQIQANPCALIGSFSVKILQYGPFPWKRFNPRIFALERSRQIQNLLPKQRKKVRIMSFFTLKLSVEAKKIEIFPKFQRQMEKTNIFKCKPPEVHFTITKECHIINHLLTQLARAVPGNIGPRSFSYGPRCARSVLPRPWANIPQYGPRVRLVRGQYFKKPRGFYSVYKDLLSL